MGTYYATRNETIIQQAMNTLERFFEALRKARVKEQIEGFYRTLLWAYAPDTIVAHLGNT